LSARTPREGPRSDPFDPAAYAAVALILAAGGLAASYWPARRATRLDPAVALRHE